MRTSASFVATLPNGRVFSDFAEDAQDMYNFPINVPFAVMAYNHEDGWFMIGAYLTREEAIADMAECVASSNSNQPFSVWENYVECYLAFANVWWKGINEDEVYAHVRAARASVLLTCCGQGMIGAGDQYVCNVCEQSYCADEIDNELHGD